MRLSVDKHVNYARFRKLWDQDFARWPEARKLDSDLAWHTIRSYIKGIRSQPDDELSPDEFAALPRRRRSVSEETFRFVYDRVWNAWYKRICEEGDLWDDQDLAAHVLESGIQFRDEYTAVFCDEAQDFTPIELDIIFQLPLFGRRSLQPEELSHVPIVFAGDPLQTINPTGFRWDAVQADFHDRFCAILEPRRRGHVEVRYRELKLNYRSNPGIVQFCNLIQLLRRALLGSKDVQPQEAWWVDRPVQPVSFEVESVLTQDELLKRPDLVKIVNCEEGEEADFVRSDSVLRNLKDEPEGVFPNVLGPTRAKGLEFSSVVLYKFGESAPANFEELLRGEVDLTDPESRLPIEYFLNRLYVAASRAKGQLIIVDTSKAITKFWRFASDETLLEKLMANADCGPAWRNSITYLVAGTEGAWRGERIDPARQAVEYATQGRRKRDPYLMRQAALAYRSAGETNESGRSLAFAAELEDQYIEAGMKYQNLGLYDDAFRCYWKGLAWSHICLLTAQQTALADRLQTRAADFMEHGKSLDSVLLTRVIDASADNEWLDEIHGDQAWQSVLMKLMKFLLGLPKETQVDWRSAYLACERVAQRGISVGGPSVALLAYRAGEIEEAVRQWERMGNTDSDDYRMAKAELTPFPECLMWLGRLRAHHEILRRLREHRSALPSLAALPDTSIRFLLDAALSDGDVAVAVEAFSLQTDYGRVLDLLRLATDRGTDEDRRKVIRSSVKALMKSRNWGAVVRVAENADFTSPGQARPKDIEPLFTTLEDRNEVLAITVQEMAISDELLSESVKLQEIVAGFLHRNFIGKTLSPHLQSLLPPEWIGAAIERAGKIIDALQYYEALEHDAQTEELRKFATERVVRNLERHADYFASRNDDVEAQQRLRRAQLLRLKPGIGNRKIPDHPELESPAVRAPQSEWIFGSFKVILSKAHLRIRVEHLERFETITIDAKNNEMRGDAKFLDAVADKESTRAWNITDWDANVQLQSHPTGRKVVLVCGGQTQEFDFS